MPRRSITLLSAAVLLLAALAVAGCGGSGSAAPPTTKDGKAATLGVANDSIGKVLVNTQGRTLYLFNKDSGTQSSCTGACAVNWPPLRANGKPTVGSGANASLTMSTAQSGGRSQITYNGHPLYLFKGDQKAGQTNGEGLTAFGGQWFAVSPAGNQVSPTTASPAGGGGY